MKIVLMLILVYFAWRVGGDWYYAVIGFFLGCTCKALHYAHMCARMKKLAEEEAKKLENGEI